MIVHRLLALGVALVVLVLALILVAAGVYAAKLVALIATFAVFAGILWLRAGAGK